MAGLLDSLFSGYGGGGLLSGLMYPSPLLQPQEQPAQPQYDAMGNSFGAASIPMTAKDPFGPPPNLEQWAKQFAPQNTPFGGSAAPAPFAAPPAFAPGPTVAPPQAAQPQPPVAQGVDFPQNQIGVGGYQMPRVGDASNFMPQTPTDISAQSRQPQQMAPEASQGLPPALGGLSVLQRLGNPDGLIAKLTGNDSRSIAQQNLKAQYDALVPVVGPQKALLAVLNPEAGKTILAQALEKQQPTFGIIGEADGGGKAYGFIDPTKKSVTPYTPPGSGEERTVMGPDGKPIPIPPGVDAKTFRNEVSRANAKAAAGEKTEVQAKAEIFANKMELAGKTIDALGGSQGTSLAGKIASGVPLGNYVQSPEYQQYKQASSNFITALLRQESGAAISKSEFDRYDKEYMPQPGDSPAVLSQKAEARRIAIEGMKKGAGPGYKAPTASPLPAGWSVTVR